MLISCHLLGDCKVFLATNLSYVRRAKSTGLYLIFTFVMVDIFRWLALAYLRRQMAGQQWTTTTQRWDLSRRPSAWTTLVSPPTSHGQPYQVGYIRRVLITEEKLSALCMAEWVLLLWRTLSLDIWIYGGLRRVQSDVTELNWHGLVYDELTNGQVVMNYSRHWLVHHKLNSVS